MYKNVVKTNLPDMLATINRILEFVINSEE